MPQCFEGISLTVHSMDGMWLLTNSRIRNLWHTFSFSDTRQTLTLAASGVGLDVYML